MEERKSKQRERKEAIVASLAQKAERAKAFVFTNPSGMTHKQLENLKRGLRAVEAELVITKNTLLRLALKNEALKNLSGQTATVFSFGDPLAALKEIAKTIKALNLPTLKLGFFEGRTLTAEELTKLSLLPSSDVLLAKLVGNLQAPLYGLHRSLSWNLQRLMVAIRAVEKSKQASSSSPPAGGN